MTSIFRDLWGCKNRDLGTKISQRNSINCCIQHHKDKHHTTSTEYSQVSPELIRKRFYSSPISVRKCMDLLACLGKGARSGCHRITTKHLSSGYYVLWGVMDEIQDRLCVLVLKTPTSLHTSLAFSTARLHEPFDSRCTSLQRRSCR